MKIVVVLLKIIIVSYNKLYIFYIVHVHILLDVIDSSRSFLTSANNHPVITLTNNGLLASSKIWKVLEETGWVAYDHLACR